MAELVTWSPGNDPVTTLAIIDAWAETVAECGLVEAFGGSRPTASGAGLLDALEAFASVHWDFRGGRERNLARVPQLTVEQLRALEASVASLGLDGTPPPRRDRYDAVVMTGGMVRAGIVKPRYLRELADAGIGFDEGVFLGGFRAFAGDEIELAHALGVDGDDEFDSMVTGMIRAFGPLPQPRIIGHADENPNASWRELTWDCDGHSLHVVAAPSSVPQLRRANTRDTYRFWASRVGRPLAVLVITTPVYVPYQGAVAIEVLGLEYGFAVETVAVSSSASDLGQLTQPVLPHHQLQELRSAVSGMRSLRAALVTRFERATGV